jgi:Domain of unknown function (DUF5668)/Putative adhesin
MSSPVLTPRKRRSMTGPFVLIVVGVIFLLGNMHLISWGRLGAWFAHYWPLLLIIWGVLKLVEHQRARQEGAAAPGIGAGGVILLIFLIIAGLTAGELSHVRWDELSDQWGIDEDHFPFHGNSFEFDEQATHELPAGAAVKVVNDHGAVNVNVSDNEKIEINAHKKVRADKEDQANQWNEQTKPQITVSGNLVTINANTRGAGNHPILADLNISLPRKAALTIAAQHGDVNVMGRDGTVEIANQRGDVNVQDVNGNVNLDLDRSSVNMGSHSSAHVSQVSGDVSVQGRSDEVSITDVKGAVRMNGDFTDSVKLSKIGKSVSFKTSRTDIELAKLVGDLDLDSDSLRADNLGGPLHVSTRSKDITLEAVSGDARIQNENSTVQIGLKAPGNIQIDNRNGDITVGVPDKVGFKLDARSQGGEVDANFPGVKVVNDDNGGTGAGMVGNGAAHLVLNSQHGNVTVHKGTSENAHSTPEPPEPPSPPKVPKPPRNASPPDGTTEN